MSAASKTNSVVPIGANAGRRPATPDFISSIEVNLGPPGLLGRFFLGADAAVRSRGVVLSFASFEALAEVNAANRDSWSSLVPIFDPKECRIAPDTGLCILGRDETGRVVAASAARLLDLKGSTLQAAAETLELFYPDRSAEERRTFTCSLSASMAKQITGKTVYSGATWFHPDFRRRGLSFFVSKMIEAAAATHWGAPHTFSFVTAELIQRGIPLAYGYPNLEWGLDLKRGDEQIYQGALIWMDLDELYRALGAILDRLDRDTQVDGVAVNRRA